MVTTVGTETTYPKLVRNLLLLEHDAIAAYDQTIERLENPAWKQQIGQFRADHERHVAELTRLASALGEDAPTEGDAKQLLTTGKVAMASMFGDKTIMSAMRSNEEDTVSAYDRASQHAEAPEEARLLFRQALEDEMRHRAWMDGAANSG